MSNEAFLNALRGQVLIRDGNGLRKAMEGPASYAGTIVTRRVVVE